MEVFGLAVPVWIIVILLLIVTLYMYGTWPYSTWSKLGVPGPPPVIFLGNMPELFKPGGHVEASRKWLQKYGRVFGIYNFRAPILYVTDPEAIKQILVTDFNSFPDRHFFSDRILVHKEVDTALFFSTGGTWKRIRSVMSPMLSGSKLRLMSACIDRCSSRLAEHLVKATAGGQPVDIKRLTQAFGLDTIAGTGFSIDTDALVDLDTPLVRHARSLFRTGPYIAYFYFMAALFPALTRPIFKMFNIGFFKQEDLLFFETAVGQMIKDRHSAKERNTDFLQLLVDAEVDEEELLHGEGKKLSTEEIVAQCLIVYIAGFETTSSSLQFVLYLLAKNQDVQTKLLEEVDQLVNDLDGTSLSYEHCNQLTYMNMVIKEALRLYPPSSLIFRLAEKDTTVKGIPVPAKAGIWIPVHVISRDPEFFEEPDKFDPSRFEENSDLTLKHNVGTRMLTWLPFGAGPRHCVGMRLAVLELKMALVRILSVARASHALPDVLVVNDVTSLLQPTEPILIQFEKRERSV